MSSPLILKIYHACPAPLRRLLSSTKKNYDRKAVERKLQPIRVDACLLGGDNGIPAASFARMVGDPLRASRPIADWPQVKLLRQYDEIGDRLWQPEALEATEYYQNAVNNVEMAGRYHGAVALDQIPLAARAFVERYRNPSAPAPLGTKPEPITVRPIKDSACFQVIDGHERLAIAYLKKVQAVEGLIEEPPVTTPLQDLLFDVSWLKGRRELYQPIDSPELSQWVLVRRCTDRLRMMKEFLGAEGIEPHAHSYLDVASFYGWFVNRMGLLGFKAEGVERDPTPIAIGKLVYGLQPEQLHRADCVAFLKALPHKYDVVSCFSLAHHFVLKDLSVSPTELLHILDSVTGRVLFFDMGQAHEFEPGSRLAQWDAPYIQKWLETNSTFTRIIPLGIDEDAVPPFERDYARMLFACVR